MNLLKQAYEEEKQKRLAGPVGEKVLRVQRVDIGSFESIKKQLKESIMDSVSLEVDKALNRVDGRIEDFTKLLAGLQIKVNGLVNRTGGTYTVSNVTSRRTLNANDTSLNELADVVATLIQDLQVSRIIK